MPTPSNGRPAPRGDVDAVVIGAGHNGLVAAALLADAGWDVLVLEAQPEPGGAVRSAELVPGYVSDLFSAFYPMSVGLPGAARSASRRARSSVDPRPRRGRARRERVRRGRAGHLP